MKQLLFALTLLLNFFTFAQQNTSNQEVTISGKVLEEGTPDQIASSELAQRYYLGDDFAL